MKTGINHGSPDAAAATTRGTENGRAFTATDLAMLNRLSDPQLSPDGRWLVYSQRSTDWEGNAGFNSLWVLDRQSPGAPPRRLEVSDKTATTPRWSADGQRLYFLSPRSGASQVWCTDVSGAVATQVTDLRGRITSFRLSPNGETLVVAVTPEATRPKRRSPDGPHPLEAASGKIFDRLPLFVWDEWRDGDRAQLFAIGLDAAGSASTEPVAVMAGLDAEAPERPFGNDADYTLSDQDVVFSALAPGSAWGVDMHYVLYVSRLDGSAPPHPLRGEAPYVRRAKPTFSPDGRKLAFLAQQSGFDERRAAVMVRDMDTGEEYEANPTLDRSATSITWARDGQTIYATVPDQGRTRLYAINVADRTAVPLTDAGEVTAVSACADRLVAACSSMGSPPQLYELANGDVSLLTQVNAETLSGVSLSDYEQFSFAGWNDELVHGYVMRPFGYAPGGKYPVAFLIHGGPHGAYSDAWSYRWNPQVWSGMGFAVVTIDFHGSSGYGEAFAQSVVGHWGDRPLEDLQKGWAAALAKYPYLDAGRACALGGSYGGYMVTWIAGVWNEPWRCLVDHNGIFDTRGMATSSDVTGWMDYAFGEAPIWQDLEKFERFNPISKIGNWSKPILVIHGGRDRRVPLEQGLAAYTMARRMGVPSKFLYHPDENHWVQKPQNSVQWYRTVQDWMVRWTRQDADCEVSA